MGQRRHLRLGEYEFGTAPVELRRNGARIPIQPQPARTLEYLIDRAGEIVTREELKREIWGDEGHRDLDQAINFAIRKIRAALDDDVGEPRYIETVPRTGYRLIAPVGEILLDRRAPDRGIRSLGVWARAAAIAIVAASLASAGWLAGSLRDEVPAPAMMPSSSPRLAVLSFSETNGSEVSLANVLEEELAASLTEMYGDQLRILVRPPRLEGDSLAGTEPAALPETDFVISGAIIYLPEGARVSVSLRQAQVGVALWSSVDVIPEHEMGRWVDRTVLELGSALGLPYRPPPIPS